jgi:uncharacterized membrane protein YedE/YeeE
MIRLLAALAAGLLFGAGLALSAMTDPAVVLGFLDVAGAWNPTLAFVMAGALTVTLVGYRIVLKRGRAVLEPRLALPTARAIDAPLVGGAALFGVGWGLAGYCPGPALASLAGAQPGTIVFVAAMLVGMVAARLLRGQAAPAAPSPGRA